MNISVVTCAVVVTTRADNQYYLENCFQIILTKVQSEPNFPRSALIRAFRAIKKRTT